MGACSSRETVIENGVARKLSLFEKRPLQVKPRDFEQHMMNLTQRKTIIAEYIWIDGAACQKGELLSNGLRSKQRSLNLKEVKSLK